VSNAIFKTSVTSGFKAMPPGIILCLLLHLLLHCYPNKQKLWSEYSTSCHVTLESHSMATALFAVITAIPGVVWFALFFTKLVLWAECQEQRKQWRVGLETGGLSQNHNLFHYSIAVNSFKQLRD